MNFIDAPTGARTDTIEGTEKALKMKISHHNRTNSYNEEANRIENCLDDFCGEDSHFYTV
ncbi:hypothetical protein HZS_5875 [Henneguya salminicola]|nr:hypothetical protein HZS_5875 [Henneguya salminicola]